MALEKMSAPNKRRTHNDPIEIRSYAASKDYWDELDVRRRYSIPHSDGTFFSDGTGYSNGELSDLRYEIRERVFESVARLEAIKSDLESEDSSNSPGVNSIPFARELEIAIREYRSIEGSLASQVVEDRDQLEGWKEYFLGIAQKFFDWASSLSGDVIREFSVAAAKSAGNVIGRAGGVAIVLYFAGVDAYGIAMAITALVAALDK